MRLWPSVVLLAAVLPVLCFGQAEGTDKPLPTPSEVLLEIPKCAQSCLTSTVSKSSCSLDDMKCICDSKAIEDEASKCILSSCPLPQALAAKNITSSACNYPVRDKAGQYSAMSISLGTITVLLVLIRVAFKQFFSTAQSLGPDDKVILGTLALRISCTIINVQGLAAHGLGKDVWTMDPSELTTFVKFLYVMEILYLAELSLIKLSLSLFYLFIFPGAIIRRLLWGTAIFNILFGVAFVVTAVFQCSPISYYWTQYVEHSGGNCVNINVFGWANAAISVAADIWLIALPLSQVRALNLHWKKKLGVTVMFLTGAFVTIVSILRLRSLIFFANSSNPTWDQWSIAYWSTIEVNVGMICTCLPSLRLILLRLFPQLGSGSRSGRSYGVQSQAQTNASKRLSNKEQHHLSDLESSKGHPWQRIDTESIS